MEKYELLQLEIIAFHAEDVIVTSNTGESHPDNESGEL